MHESDAKDPEAQDRVVRAEKGNGRTDDYHQSGRTVLVSNYNTAAYSEKPRRESLRSVLTARFSGAGAATRAVLPSLCDRYAAFNHHHRPIFWPRRYQYRTAPYTST